MNRDDIKKSIFEVLEEIAPEAELDELDPNENFRDALEIDSFDFLNVLVGISEKLKVEIPEGDYPKVETLNQMLDYLEK